MNRYKKDVIYDFNGKMKDDFFEPARNAKGANLVENG